MKSVRVKISCLVLFFSISTAGYSGVRFPERLPSGWKKSGSMRSFNAQNLFQYINGGAEIFREFGFTSMSLGRYAGGDEEISIECYEMENPEAALGIYLIKCGRETPWPQIPSRNTGNPFQLTVLKGCYFTQINNASGNRTNMSVMADLAAQLFETIPEETAAPFTLLPEGFIKGSEMLIRGPYAMEPVFTFGKGDVLLLRGNVFCRAGDYRDEGGNVYTVMIIPYPSENASGEAFQHLVQNLDSYLVALYQDENRLVFMDHQNRYGEVLKTGHTLAIKIKLASRPI